jgi:membrane-bound lytic murein transglycosylase B
MLRVRRIAILLALALAGCGAEERPAAPAPEPPPAVAPGPAAQLRDTHEALLAAIDTWLAGGERDLPAGVARLAVAEMRVHRRLARHPAELRALLPQLPAAQRAYVRDDVLARRELLSIHSVVRQRPRIRLGDPPPAATLRAHYRRAWRRFGVGPPLLAAVNLVETAFGRLRSESTAGARGPMQFMPATWRAYGLGGDVRDPRDAILGAAHYLHANGAPHEEARALFHYNPSRAYVTAVRRYARMIRRDDRVFYALYARPVRLP